MFSGSFFMGNYWAYLTFFNFLPVFFSFMVLLDLSIFFWILCPGFFILDVKLDVCQISSFSCPSNLVFYDKTGRIYNFFQTLPTKTLWTGQDFKKILYKSEITRYPCVLRAKSNEILTYVQKKSLNSKTLGNIFENSHMHPITSISKFL